MTRSFLTLLFLLGIILAVSERAEDLCGLYYTQTCKDIFKEGPEIPLLLLAPIYEIIHLRRIRVILASLPSLVILTISELNILPQSFYFTGTKALNVQSFVLFYTDVSGFLSTEIISYVVSSAILITVYWKYEKRLDQKTMVPVSPDVLKVQLAIETPDYKEQTYERTETRRKSFRDQ